MSVFFAVSVTVGPRPCMREGSAARGRGAIVVGGTAGPGGAMRHDWIIEVLSDLRAYALKNRLPLLAERTEDVLSVARAEIAARTARDDDADGGAGEGGGTPPHGMPH